MRANDSQRSVTKAVASLHEPVVLKENKANVDQVLRVLFSGYSCLLPGHLVTAEQFSMDILKNETELLKGFLRALLQAEVLNY